jgi:hypothetical protein
MEVKDDSRDLRVAELMQGMISRRSDESDLDDLFGSLIS